MFFKKIRKEYTKYAFLIALAIFLLLTYSLIRSNISFLNSKLVFLLIFFDVVLILFICLFVYQRIRGVLSLRYSKSGGRKFHKQITILFSCMAILPSVCVFGFSMLFFNIGIENLFKTPVKNVIDNAEQVADIYINDLKFNMENFVNWVGSQLENCVTGVSIDKEKINSILLEETESSKADAIVIQKVDNNTMNVLASTPFSLPIQFENVPDEIFKIDDGKIIAWESIDSVASAIVLNKELGIYLIASVPISHTILEHKHEIKDAITEYSNLATQRSGLKITFMTFFSVITLLLLLTSIFVAVIFANRILRPINKLIIATKNVTSGDYNTPIKLAKTNSEFDILIATFNDMISKLEQQKQQLIISNKQNAWRDIARKIAHEIKNPLTPIQLSAERLKNKYQKEIISNPEVFNSCINTIIRQVGCIGNLVKEFSDFARMPAPKMENVNIIELIKQAVFIQANAHKSIHFHQSYDNEKYFCEIDQAQINQVLMNVIQNAVNAIVENNQNREDILGNIIVDFYVKEGNIYLSIEDDGPGFSDSAIKKALEPYYTTREFGTGLGLAIVHKILIDHNGKVKLGKSNVLGGAKVLLEIPSDYKKVRQDGI